MGRRAARALHLALSALGAVLYFLFVIPRWWVLTGDIPATAATVGRIATGLVIAGAAVPVALWLKGSLQPKADAPELALRLRAWSAVLHVAAGALITVTAVAEIWLGLQAAGPWLFGIYGAAGSVAVLAVLGFVLSFTAEKPPAPAKTPKDKTRKIKTPKKRRKDSDDRVETVTDETITAETITDETITAETITDETVTDETVAVETVTDETVTVAESPEDAEAEPGALRNKRPTGKTRHRLRR